MRNGSVRRQPQPSDRHCRSDGQPFELWFAPKGPTSPAQVGELLTGLERDSAISDITAQAEAVVSVNGRTVASLASQSLRG